MSDDRGPITGPAGATLDSGPRTGPPMGRVAPPVAAPEVVSEAPSIGDPAGAPPAEPAIEPDAASNQIAAEEPLPAEGAIAPVSGLPAETADQQESPDEALATPGAQVTTVPEPWPEPAHEQAPAPLAEVTWEAHDGTAAPGPTFEPTFEVPSSDQADAPPATEIVAASEPAALAFAGITSPEYVPETTQEPASEPSVTGPLEADNAPAAPEPTLEPTSEVPSPDQAGAPSATEIVADPEPTTPAAATLPVPPPAAAPAAPPMREAASVAAAAVAAARPPVLGGPAPTVPPATPPAARARWARLFRRAALLLAGLGVGYAVLVLVLIVAYRWVDPPRSALMLTTRLAGQSVLYAPVPLTSISSYLQRAVVTSEDARFCYHHGVDWAALFEAMNESRGGSTITMQTAKNLFLWPSRSYVRKAIEIPVALAIDAFWPKRRILEVYLNIAEWGPGIFGAEAAAHYHFDKPASRLTAREATLLAATLPNPIARDAGEPGRITSLLASRLRGRMAHSDVFVRCLGLRPVPRSEPRPASRPATKPAPRPQPAQRPAAKVEPQPKATFNPWQTTTEPAFNPWQN